MIIGYKSLMKSAEMSGMEELEDDGTRTKEELEKENRTLKALMPIVTVISVIFSVVLCVGLFFWLPTFVYDLLAPLLGVPAEIEGHFGYNLLKAFITGVLKILIFLIYMIVIAQMNDIKRVFSYHGAEHKTIFCYENGEELTVENVKKQSRFHPRCGTSFMILMMFVGVAVSMFIPQGLNAWYYTLIKLLTLPLVMGIGYEALKLAGRHDNWFTRFISAPGKWMQRITTAEPTDDMIECAIAAFKAVIPEEENSDNW